MSEFSYNSERLGRIIALSSEMYSMLWNAMDALRCAGVGDTRFALSKAHEIELLLNRIDREEAEYE